jgi:hypothetical protein
LPQFAFLQLRPMTARAELEQVTISEEEIERAFCFSSKALGNAVKQDMADLVFVKPDAFDPAKTMEIAREISRMNAMPGQSRPKIPARWAGTMGLGRPMAGNSGCMGRHLRRGMPWSKQNPGSNSFAEPSQGSHFFHNITTLGINYITVSKAATATGSTGIG